MISKCEPFIPFTTIWAKYFPLSLRVDTACFGLKFKLLLIKNITNSRTVSASSTVYSARMFLTSNYLSLATKFSFYNF